MKEWRREKSECVRERRKSMFGIKINVRDTCDKCNIEWLINELWLVVSIEHFLCDCPVAPHVN